MPLSRTLPVHNENTFGNRLHDLTRALQAAKIATEDSRAYNRERLQQKANAGKLEVGDSVILKAEARDQFTSRWDPQFEIIRIRGPVIWIRHQKSNKVKKVNRSKVKLVDPNISWDDCRPRPPRQLQNHPEQQPIIKQSQPLPEVHEKPQDDVPLPDCAARRRKVHYFLKRQDPIAVGVPAEKRSQLAETANQQPAVSRSGRQLKLSQRAREALDEREETDIEVDPQQKETICTL